MKFLRSTTTLPLLLLLSGTQQHVTALDLPKYTDMDTAKLFVGNFNRETKGVSSFTLQFPPACGETYHNRAQRKANRSILVLWGEM